MFCPNCGMQVEDGNKFCGGCGKPITQSPTPSVITGNNLPDSGVEQFIGLTGRLNRLRYFKRTLVVGLLSGAISVLLGEMVGMIASLLLLWPEYCLMVRRLHDLNRDNKIAVALMAISAVLNVTLLTDNMELIGAVTIVGGIAGLVMGLYLLFAKGTNGPNKYGPDPLEIL